MRNRSRLLLAAIGAIALLGMAVGAASAGRLEVSNSANGFKIVWTRIRLEAAGLEAQCPATLEGTFERATYAKRITERIGRVTGANIGTCNRNRATLLRETLPWEVQYDSFVGVLPSITTVSLNVIRMSFRANLEGIECLAATTTQHPVGVIARLGGEGPVIGVRFDETREIETVGGFFCSIGGPAHFAGEAAFITNRAGVAAITIRLI